MANPTLPSDLIIDIVTRLPSKTLIRFKSVSKKWYSLINSPNFINLHLSQTLISPIPPNLIISRSSLFSADLSDQNNPNFHLIELDHPLKHFPYYSRKLSPQIIGSVNGVVCVSTYDKSSVVLYNPSTKTHRFIPPFASNSEEDSFDEDFESNIDEDFVYGFGFDSVSGDYKVLRFFETITKSDMLYHEASVYSLRSDSWKCVSDDETMAAQLVLNPHSMGVLVNEVLHFVGIDTCSVPSVWCFDLRDETFSFLNFPKFDTAFNPRVTRYVIKELGGCLSVMVNYKNGELLGGGAMARVDLWVMKEYGTEESWFRLFSIRDPSSLNVRRCIYPVVYSRDKERVLFNLDGFSFGWYSWGSQSFERITVNGWHSYHGCCDTLTYVDSLVSIGKVKDKSKSKVLPKKNKNKIDRDAFLSAGFKLKL